MNLNPKGYKGGKQQIMEERKKLAILILIGGKSTRFGTEKPILNLFGKPLILHQIDILSEFDEDLFLVAHSEKQINFYKTLKLHNS